MRRVTPFAALELTVAAISSCATMQRVAVAMDAANRQRQAQQAQQPRQPMYITASYKSEVVTGWTKQCFYDNLGTVYTKTVGSMDWCNMMEKFPIN